MFCHNLKGYDSHFIISEANKYEAKKITCIAQNSEKFLAFGFNRFEFKDSMSFLGTSLEKLVKLNKYKGGQKQANWEENFHEARCVLNEYIHSTDDFDALSEKRIYLNAILLLLKPIRLLHFGQLTRRAYHLVLLAVKAI